MIDPLGSNANLIVYLDVKSPFAFVAYRQVLKLEAEVGCHIDYRPLTLNIPSYLGSAEKRHGQVVSSKGRSQSTWQAIRYNYSDARRYAERQGLTLRGTEKIWDSRLINIALWWVAQHHKTQLEAFLHAVFPAFWDRAFDIESMNTTRRCLHSLGLDDAAFESFYWGGGGAEHDALQAALHPAGIFGVPSFVVDREVLHGREHIPWIRWYLSGQRGPAPDIAYELAPC